MRMACLSGAAAAAGVLCAWLPSVAAAASTGITVSPASLNFSYQVNNSTLPPAAKLTATLPSGVSASTIMSVQVTCTPPGWLAVTPASGHSPLALTVTANPTGLAPANYPGSITITNTTTPSMSVTVNVSLSITNPPSTLLLGPTTSLNFSSGSGTTNPSLSYTFTTGDVATSPANAVLNVASSGDIIPFNVTTALSSKSAAGNWIQVNQTNQLPSASTSGVALSGSLVPITVSLDLPAVQALDPGSYGGVVTIAANNKVNGSIAVNVNLVVSAGAPQITSIFPATIVAGPVVDPVITIYGQNFFSTSVVSLQQGTGTPMTLSSTLLGRQVLQATISAKLLMLPGLWTLAVSNPAPPNNPSQKPDTATFTVASPNTPVISAVVNAASYLPSARNAPTNTTPIVPGQTSVAPREIISIFGQNLVNSANLNGATVLNATPSGTPSAYQPGPFAGVTVTMKGASTTYSLPILMVSSNQVNAIVPAGLSSETSVTIQLCTAPASCTAVPPAGGFPAMPVEKESPGIFTFGGLGQGQGAILNYNGTTQGYSINSSSAGAARGSTIVIYGTGLGDFQPLSGSPMIDGQVAPATALAVSDQTVRVDIGGQPAVVSYAGTCPGAVAGLVQINAVVPPTVTPGAAVPIAVSIGDPATARQSQAGVTLNVTK